MNIDFLKRMDWPIVFEAALIYTGMGTRDVTREPAAYFSVGVKWFALIPHNEVLCCSQKETIDLFEILLRGLKTN